MCHCSMCLILTVCPWSCCCRGKIIWRQCKHNLRRKTFVVVVDLDKTRSHSNVDQRSSWFCLSSTLFKFNYELVVVVVVCLLYSVIDLFLSLETCPVLHFLSLDFVSRVNVNRFLFLSSPLLFPFSFFQLGVLGLLAGSTPPVLRRLNIALLLL